MRDLRKRLLDDTGITLAEVIVVCLLGVLVLTTVGGIYISTITVQQTVSTLTGTTTEGQLVARSVDRAVRNGSEFEITTLPSGDQLLRVRTLDGSEAAVWRCAAWYFSTTAGGSIRSATASDSTIIPVPDATALAGWTLLADGVSAPESGRVFDIASELDSLLTVDFSTTDDDHEHDTSRIKFSTPLMPEASEEGTCF